MVSGLSRMVNKSEHIEIPEVGCPRFANVKRQLEAEDARETRVFNGLFNGSMRRVCTYRVFNGFALFDHTANLLGRTDTRSLISIRINVCSREHTVCR